MILFNQISILEFFTEYSVDTDVCFRSCYELIFTIKKMLL